MLKALCNLPYFSWQALTKLLLIMNFTAILLLTTCLAANAAGYSQNLSISLKNAPLEKLFEEIKKQTSYSFVYYKDDLTNAKKLNLHIRNVGLEEVMQLAFKDQPLDYIIIDKTIVIKEKLLKVGPEASSIPAPSIDVKGRILNETGEAVAGASIMVKGSNQGTTTNEMGEFELKNVDENATLVFSSVNMQTFEMKIEGRTYLVVSMKQNILELDKTVITALGIKREKRNLTYSTQEIKGAELLKTKEPNILNAMAGKVSGVQITSSSGTPGSSTRIVIRGATSVMGDNQALIIVDGVPINNAETGASSPGAGSSRIIDIDPSTIENINVLKGAAATALYGASGARGVVIITTKEGGINKKPIVSLSSEVSIDKGIFPEFQNKYALGINGVFADGDINKASASWGPLMDTLKINGQPAPKYDKIKMFFKPGVTTNNSVSLSGGNNNSGYFMSYSYYDQKGIVPTTDFKRHSVFVKYNSRITDKLSSSFQMTYSNSNQRRFPEGVFVQPGPIFVTYNQPISWNPLPIYNPDGTQRIFRNGRNNPYWDLENAYNKYSVNRFIPVISLNYQLTKWLTLSERMGADIYSEQDSYKESPSTARRTPGRLVENNINFRQFNSDFIVSANRQFGNFNVNLILGNNIYSTYTQTNNIEGVGLLINNFNNISSASTITSGERHYLQRKVGFYTQANIDYKKFLALSVTGRYDGSSVLATDNAFYPYGSVAGSFIFSELLPSEFSKVMPFGKLRISYATVGNDNVGVYSLKTPYISPTLYNIQFPFQGQAGFLLSSILGNSNLKNERLNELEIGLETRLFNNKIGIEASYFNRKSVDGIIPGVSISAATGFTGTTVNSAQISNKGLELLVNATPVKSKNFNWNITTSFTRIKNKVLSLYGDLPSLGRIIVGQPYNIFFGTRFKRNANGEVYVDAGGLPILDDTPGIIGDANPDWLAGITNNFNYKHFGLSFFIDIKKGGDIYNQTELNNGFFGTSKITENRDPIVYKGISIADNKPNTVQVSAQDLYRYYSDIDEPGIQDGSYIKLRTVSLSYNLDKQFLKRTPFQSASLILTGRNLWINAPHFTSGDPEGSTYGNSNENQGYYGYAYPSTKSYNVTIKVDF